MRGKRYNSPCRLLLAALVVAMLAFPGKSWAACCGAPDAACLCSQVGHMWTMGIIRDQNEKTRKHIVDTMRKYKDWLINDYFNNYIYQAVLEITQHLTVVGMYQMQLLGSFLDAKEMLEVQRLHQRLAAEAHRDYHPSAELCTIGTAARGLASSERNAQMHAATLARLSMDRQLGSVNTRGGESRNADRRNRLRTFKERYCDPSDNNGGLGSVCGAGAGALSSDTINKDVDFTRTVSLPRTLDFDFADNVLTDDETDIIALGEYLYAHDIPQRLTEALIKNPANHDDYLDWRSLVAKRGVAQNSYNAIVGMKSAGNEDFNNNTRYAAAVFAQLGVPQVDAEHLLASNAGQPSYYALMEVLAQKIYQDPEFYATLYDKPANVARKDVAMQAVGLMLDRDSYHSELRYESMLALMLEMELTEYQRAVQNRIDPLTEGGMRR